MKKNRSRKSRGTVPLNNALCKRHLVTRVGSEHWKCASNSLLEVNNGGQRDGSCGVEVHGNAVEEYYRRIVPCMEMGPRTTIIQS